jgi:hypothetical protein
VRGNYLPSPKALQRALLRLLSGLLFPATIAWVSIGPAHADGIFEAEFLDRILKPLLANQPFLVEGLAPFPVEANGARRFRNIEKNFTSLLHETPDMRLAVVVGFFHNHDYDRSRDHLYWAIDSGDEVEQAILAFKKLTADEARFSNAPQCVQPLPVDIPLLETVFQGSASFKSDNGVPGLVQLSVTSYPVLETNPDGAKTIAVQVFAGTSNDIPCLPGN